jgi:hypothetical protein
MKLDEKSNAQAWELEVTCRNKKYLCEYSNLPSVKSYAS